MHVYIYDGYSLIGDLLSFVVRNVDVHIEIP